MAKKVLFLFGFAALFLLLSLSFSSAAYYGGYYRNNYGGGYGYGDDYTRRTYSSTYERNGYFKTTDYGRTSERYWSGDSWVTRTSYIKETRESPNYGYGYAGPYGGGSPYPWYQKYYTYQYPPRYQYGYGSSQYGYRW